MARLFPSRGRSGDTTSPSSVDTHRACPALLDERPINVIEEEAALQLRPSRRTSEALVAGYLLIAEELDRYVPTVIVPAP